MERVCRNKNLSPVGPLRTLPAFSTRRRPPLPGGQNDYGFGAVEPSVAQVRALINIAESTGLQEVRFNRCGEIKPPASARRWDKWPIQASFSGSKKVCQAHSGTHEVDLHALLLDKPNAQTKTAPSGSFQLLRLRLLDKEGTKRVLTVFQQAFSTLPVDDIPSLHELPCPIALTNVILHFYNQRLQFKTSSQNRILPRTHTPSFLSPRLGVCHGEDEPAPTPRPSICTGPYPGG